MGSMDNQSVIVIGGTSGIGLATAITAASRGASVWAVSRSEDKVKACSDSYPEITFSSLDTHNVEGLKSLFESVGPAFAGLLLAAALGRACGLPADVVLASLPKCTTTGLAVHMAAALGDSRVILMRGHGATVAGKVHEELRRIGGVTPPREFVLMDRAAIGLGSVFLRLRAELNWHRIFHDLIDEYDLDGLTKRQSGALTAQGLELP